MDVTDRAGPFITLRLLIKGAARQDRWDRCHCTARASLLFSSLVSSPPSQIYLKPILDELASLRSVLFRIPKEFNRIQCSSYQFGSIFASISCFLLEMMMQRSATCRIVTRRDDLALLLHLYFAFLCCVVWRNNFWKSNFYYEYHI